MLQIDVKVYSSAVSPSDAPFDSRVVVWRAANRGRGTDRGRYVEDTIFWKATRRTIETEVYLSAQMLSWTLCVCVYMHVCMSITSQWSHRFHPNLCSASCKTSCSVTAICVQWMHTHSHTHTHRHEHCTQMSPESNYCCYTMLYWADMFCWSEAENKIDSWHNVHKP